MHTPSYYTVVFLYSKVYSTWFLSLTTFQYQPNLTIFKPLHKPFKQQITLTNHNSTIFNHSNKHIITQIIKLNGNNCYSTRLNATSDLDSICRPSFHVRRHLRPPPCSATSRDRRPRCLLRSRRLQFDSS
jgi:hypothetical protein